ncbi:MAG: 50S ribosomal protein L23 [Patescibacteria group bacterium]
MELKDLIVKQLQTEKSSSQLKENKYSLLVGRQAGKPEIKRALEKMYKVSVVKVNSSKVPVSQRLLARYRYSARGPSLRKVIVTLKEGQKLDFGIGEKEKKGEKK